MILDRQEYLEYISLHLALLYFAGQRNNVFPAETDFEGFIKFDFQIKLKCRDILNANTELLDEYIKSNTNSITINQIKIIEGIKKKIESDFIIFKCFAKHAILINIKDDKIYAVKALADRFDSFFKEFPVLCNMTILPFKDKIIYDGFIKSNNMYFGKNMRMEMNLKYKQAKFDKTIITMIK
jgi:hypothetical protein